MPAPRVLAFLVLFMSTTYCEASRHVLIPRGSCSLTTVNWTCPAFDLAFYPLAPNITGSGVQFDNTSHGYYLGCFYPFLSNCQYRTADGYLFADTDNGYCPTTIPSCINNGQRVFSCPKFDKADYGLGPGSQTQDDDKILFCTYPTTSQLLNNTYFCRYALNDGHLYWGIDPVFGNNPPPVFCPLSAVCPANSSANATQTTTPHCPANTSSIATSKALAPYSPTNLKSSAVLAIVMILAGLWFV